MSVQELNNQHSLIRTDDKGYKCSMCDAKWKRRPSSNCPGVHRYEYGEVPDNLLRISELDSLNLKLKEGAVRAGVLTKNWYDLYNRSDTEVIDSSLPEAITWDERSRRHLKTLGQLKKLNKKPKEGINPTAVARLLDDFEQRYIWVNLYSDEDLEDGVIQDRFITKSSLKQKYLLSDGWIKRIGEPDRYVENPHYKSGAPMQLFSSSRVENFLAQNSSEYARWLITRARKVEIYEENREAIQSGADEWRASQGRSRQDYRTYGNNNELNLLAFLQNHAEQDKKIVERQISACLCCASGCAFDSGFLCAIHPSGLSQLPCPDYMCRRS